MGKSKEPVRLRKRKMPSGNTSLYLDIYRDGKRNYEYLKLYLIPERTRADKELNRETLKFADAVRAKRLLELLNGEYDFNIGVSSRNVDFFEYYECKLTQRKTEAKSPSHYLCWESCLRHLKIYETRNIPFSHIDVAWIEGFRDYLLHQAKWKGEHRLKQSTCAIYMDVLSCFFKCAVRDKIIFENPMTGIKKISMETAPRMYLTKEELNCLIKAKCDFPETRRAFLFSCLTGMRYSDIKKLKWGDIYHQNGYTRIIFKQQKTGGQEYLDIAPQARELMGEENEDTMLVFPDIASAVMINYHLRKWVAEAGINKKITFHCARHTFATLMLDLGTDLYTVSKLLGHKDISTTQIYAKILDKKKQEAVNNISNIIDIKGEPQ